MYLEHRLKAVITALSLRKADFVGAVPTFAAKCSKTIY